MRRLWRQPQKTQVVGSLSDLLCLQSSHSIPLFMNFPSQCVAICNAHSFSVEFLCVMQLSCIDCGEIFGRDTVQDHTQCITEAVSLSFVFTFFLMDRPPVSFLFNMICEHDA